MKGFFTLKEIRSETRPDNKVYSCVSCGLMKRSHTPKMPPYGEFKKDIMVISDTPKEIDDERGKPWQGKTGRVLKKILKKYGINLSEDCLTIHAVCCRATDKKSKDKPPTSYEIDCCRKTIIKHIKEYQPKVILVLGEVPIESLLKHRWKHDIGNIDKWRGWQIPDQDFKCWVCPVFHPDYVLKQDRMEVETIWEQDINKAVEHVEKPFLKWHKPDIHYLNDLEPLRKITSSQVSIDYEATGLKPHAKGHRIICASVAVDENTAYTFLMPKSRKARQPFIDLLSNTAIGKMAHNMKFEENWSVVRLKQSVKGWDWDSMLAAHLLDNRPKICSLKFQTYVNFGIIDYDSEITPYLKAKDSNDGNAFNQIQKLLNNKTHTKQLLEYCAMDTITQYRLAMKQIKQINYSFLPF